MHGDFFSALALLLCDLLPCVEFTCKIPDVFDEDGTTTTAVQCRCQRKHHLHGSPADMKFPTLTVGDVMLTFKLLYV